MNIKILSLAFLSLLSINAQADSFIMRVTTPLMDRVDTSPGSEDNKEPINKEDPSGWLAYLQSKGYLEGAVSLSDWSSQGAIVEINEISTDNVALSSSPFGISAINELSVTDPGLTHANFLSGVTSASGVYFVNTVALKDVRGLGSLRNIDELVLANTSISDLSPLNNLSGASNLFLDDVQDKYTPKLPSDSPLCASIMSENTILKMVSPDGSGRFNFRDGVYTEICQGMPENSDWIEFFHKFYAHLDSDRISLVAANNYVDFNFYPSEDGSEPSFPNAFDSDLPPSPLPGFFSKSEMRVDLIASMFTHVDFMSNIKRIGILDIRNNFELKNLNGLLGLTEVTSISIGSNEKLTDITGLSNIQRTISRTIGGYYHGGEIYIQNINVPNRPSAGTPFCNGLRDGLINASTVHVVGTTYTTVKINYEDMCLN